MEISIDKSFNSTYLIHAPEELIPKIELILSKKNHFKISDVSPRFVTQISLDLEDNSELHIGIMYVQIINQEITLHDLTNTISHGLNLALRLIELSPEFHKLTDDL